MKFLIRDDDVNYFTKPEDLELIYRNIWQKCPISFSIVPFQTGVISNAIPEEYWQSDKIFPIGENQKLVNFLDQKNREGKIAILLHGFSHKDYPEGPEFVAGKDLERKVKEGKEYLEKIFNLKIIAFVPPHNSFSKEGFEATINNHLNIVGIPHFRRFGRLKNKNYWIPFLKKLCYKIFYQSSYPYVLNFANHKEVGFYTVSPSADYDKLIKVFNFIRKKNGVFILSTHYWEIKKDEKTREKFYNFWKYIQKFPDINFLSINELFK